MTVERTKDPPISLIPPSGDWEGLGSPSLLPFPNLLLALSHVHHPKLKSVSKEIKGNGFLKWIGNFLV